MDLNSSVNKASRLYKMYAKRLEKLGIYTFKDFLYHVPFRYDDFSLISKIGSVQAGETVTIRGEIIEISNEYTRRFKKIQKAKVKDKSGEINVIWFNQPYLLKTIRRGDTVSLSGKIEKIHFPKDHLESEEARKRLSFDELFLMQLQVIKRKTEWSKNIKGFSFKVKENKEKIDDFISSLPFKLTNAQEKVLSEIYLDLGKEKPMNRLLEGDVGSGKTVVSAITMYIAYLNNFQSVLMAPTEILASQHFNTLNNFFSPLGIKVVLVTGNKKISIQDLDFSILVGTHAVLSDKIDYKNLGLVIIDEQQRFGVEQRALIRKKGNNPHFLTMTATPIPRTIALSMYGDLDLSVIDEMPIGRKRVKTWLTPHHKRKDAYKWIEEEIKTNKIQVFVICPFIEESETMTTVKAATKELEILKKQIFPNLKLDILHGKLKAKEKEEVLNNFKNKKFDILVATPVVEVGIDVPNATIILIEAADRFGLSQLHQLRGL